MNLIFHFINARNTQEIPAFSTVFRTGDASGPMYVLLEGAANILVGGQVIEVAGPGTIFGEMALIDDQPRSATVITRSHCRVLPVDRQQFDLLIREQPEFARHVMKVIVERLRRMDLAAAAPANDPALRIPAQSNGGAKFPATA